MQKITGIEDSAVNPNYCVHDSLVSNYININMHLRTNKSKL